MLAERLAFRGTGPVDAVANIPYGWRARETSPGVYRLGDQAGVIPSLAGEGIGIALASAAAATRAILSGQSAPAFQREFARALARPLAVAGWIRALAESRRIAPLLVALSNPPLVQSVAGLTRITHFLR
jgi:flavin-dependent dehydrogenase